MPLSGKTTWIKKNVPDGTRIISRDDIISELSNNTNYNEAWHSVKDKEVNKVLYQSYLDSNKNRENVVIDMTFMRSKRRRITLDYYKKEYYKLGVTFPFLTKEEYEFRNGKRKREENKHIPYGVVEKMMSDFQPINQVEEGFDKIIKAYASK
jgi:predicted kinase